MPLAELDLAAWQRDFDARQDALDAQIAAAAEQLERGDLTAEQLLVFTTSSASCCCQAAISGWRWRKRSRRPRRSMASKMTAASARPSNATDVAPRS